MTTIWKFEFDVTDEITLIMPRGAKVMSAQAQYGKPCIWALVDTGAERERRKFRLYGTGHQVDLNDIVEFIGTFQLSGGGLVFHLFNPAQEAK